MAQPGSRTGHSCHAVESLAPRHPTASTSGLSLWSVGLGQPHTTSREICTENRLPKELAADSVMLKLELAALAAGTAGPAVARNSLR